jgi:riboflavin kinase/FMN adenylyltransferase
LVLQHTPKREQQHDEHRFQLLTPLDEKLQLLEQMGVDLVYVIPFTMEFAQTPFREFYTRHIIDGIGVAEVIEGYDHSFGKNREAGSQQLIELGSEFGFGVTVEEPVKIDGTVVSSSLIRTLLYKGDVAGAALLLGRRYRVTGKVERGDGRGQTLGFPTANLAIADENKLLPPNGVYAVLVSVGGTMQRGLLSIGVLPTFFESHRRQCEVYLFDFSGDLYGATLDVDCVAWIRQELKFTSVPDLIREMGNDSQKGRLILSQTNIS